MTVKPHLLVVDDEAGIRESLSSILEDEGYEVDAVGSAEEALERAADGTVEVILLDVWLPGMDGLEALGRLQGYPRPPSVIMISGHGTIETAVRATKLGAFDFIEKPLSLEKIVVLVRNAIQQRRLQEENQLLRSELGHRYQVIGDSVPMKALRQQIAVTAPTNGRVLIYGESGTGKELVAHALHAASLRNKGPFVEVNCAAIPEELIESELFGHIKGSFTGASEDKVGKFQKADGGTLFLDEVGDMSLRTQSKVLRVLEEQRFEPVGSSQTISVDARVIAATNKNLEQELARGASELLLEIFVGGGDHARVHGDGLTGADGFEALFFENAQDFRLRAQAHVANFVEEERAAVSFLKLADFIFTGAGEAALNVAEKFGLDQFFGNGGAVYFDERTFVAKTGGVQRVRNEFLAGAALAVNEDATVGGSSDGNLLAQRLHRDAVADDLIAMAELAAKQLIFFLEAALLNGVAHQHNDFFE